MGQLRAHQWALPLRILLPSPTRISLGPSTQPISTGQGRNAMMVLPLCCQLLLDQRLSWSPMDMRQLQAHPVGPAAAHSALPTHISWSQPSAHIHWTREECDDGAPSMLSASYQLRCSHGATSTQSLAQPPKSQAPIYHLSSQPSSEPQPQP